MGKKLFAEGGKIVAREMAPKRCECDAFNEAVNEEVLVWDVADEEQSGVWTIGGVETINFCPFCGHLVPLSGHSNA